MDTIIIKSYSFNYDEELKFPAYITDFSDNYTSNWKSEQIYGKMDPIATFQNTSRKVSLSFDLPSANLADAINNFKNINYLIRGLYPVYNSDEKFGIATIGSPPFFRIRYTNLLYNPASKDGLLCYLDGGFNFTPDIASGYFIDYQNKSAYPDNNAALYPKLIKASLAFTVIHEVPLGSKAGEKNITPRLSIEKNLNTFPYISLTSFTPSNTQDKSPSLVTNKISAAISQAATKKLLEEQNKKK